MHDSPPPTPPSRYSTRRDERRFESITLPCEWVENYRPGGFHPVNLDDLFHDGQYKVIRKLGQGSFSTVWLARDQSNNRYVALKILVGASESAKELQILHHLAQVAPSQMTQRTTQLLDEFEHIGPNGIHTCLVFEPMGPSVDSMVEELPQFKPRRFGMNIRYPPPMARSILKQALQGLAVLHENGIAHGDFQPGNMLFALDDIHSKPEDVLWQDTAAQPGPVSAQVQRLDGKPDKWAPQKLYAAQPLAPLTRITEDFQIKLSDMGGAFFFTDPPTKPIVPLGLRAPELVLAGEVNKTIDLWSFGCLVFELMTGQPLFCVFWNDSETEQDDDHLLSLTTRLGPLPEALYRKWKTTSLYFTPDRQLFNFQLGGVPEGGQPLVLEHVSMEEMFDRAKPDIDAEEAAKVKKLVRRILQYDPAQRPSPAELLRDPWFCDGESGSGSS
ncbi:Serine/threonine-protein kinase SRPK3 [Apiospora aurea]|uniref:non-specific serine/threonine protein kinase n=1 Tax=Apiospora aurea TaxID=335848 RepID=A0ABR1Q3Z3_9PEZI